MTITQAFKHLLDNWKEQDKSFKDKYRSYKSKHEKSKTMKSKEIQEKHYYVGEGKIQEMLKEAGYKIEVKVKAPK